jgi:chemotaxis protein CheC
MELGPEQLDALRKMSMVGMDRAAVALSQLMKRDISFKVPRVLTMDVARLPEFLGGRRQMVMGVCLKILGDARGNIMMIFTRDDAARMLEMLLSRETVKGALLTELEVSALKEVGNILASAYLNALGELFSKTFIPSVPMLTLDMAGEVVDYLLDEAGEGEKVAIMIDTEFSERDRSFAGHFFLLPVLSSFSAMMEGIGV